ncbi:lycopene cyclase domain-containing protein [Microbacterium soli]|uniref:Lycopene cyclase domain-containing protein n=1 Tax=Microbacterium soli TaxID=446075 RepID=A0ABP7NEE6_9MICO
MTYPLLSVILLAAVVVLTAALRLAAARRPATVPVLLTITVLLALTLVFDAVMITAGFFSYEPSRLLGVHIGPVPVEDLSYPLAAGVLLPAVWAALRSRRDTDEGPGR